jgi:AraC family transcriptional regulator
MQRCKAQLLSFVLALFLMGTQDLVGQELSQEPQIVESPPRKLVGMSRAMSRIEDKTAELWGAFMPRLNEITGRRTEDYISMQVFPSGPEQLSNPSATFTKFAVVEVHDFESVPKGMISYTLPSGVYAVFEHNGPASDLSTFMYIFNGWLPSSERYELDDREHFEVLPKNYDALDPNATEEIWIPVRSKD